MDDNRTSLRDFGRAVEALLNGRPRGWLGAEVARVIDPARAPFSASAVTQWIDGDTEPTRDKVFAMERVLGVEPGRLSRYLGYLPVDAVPATNVRDAIDSDPRLPDEFKPTVLRIYDALATIPATDPSPSGSKRARTAKTRPSA